MRVRILTLSFFFIISLLLIGCKDNYDRGYNNGLKQGRSEGYSKGLNEGYNKGRKSGFDDGYAQAMKGISHKIEPKLETIDGKLFSSKGMYIMFWFFSGVNMLALFLGGAYLIAKNSEGTIILAKSLAVVIASYFWFRLFQSDIFNQTIQLTERSKMFESATEVIALFFGLGVCSLFNNLFIKRDIGIIWVEIIALGFITVSLFQLLLYLLNYKVLFIIGGPTYLFHVTESLCIGGLIYIVYALIIDYCKRRKVAT